MITTDHTKRQECLAKIAALKAERPAGWEREARKLCEQLADWEGLPEEYNSFKAALSAGLTGGKAVAEEEVRAQGIGSEDGSAVHFVDPSQEIGSQCPYCGRTYADEEEQGEQPHQHTAGYAVDGLRRVLQFIRGNTQIAPQCEFTIGRRAIAVLWIVDPAAFGGISLTKLAGQLGCKAPSLARITGEASRVLGVRSPGQSHASGTWRGPGQPEQETP